MGCPGYRDRMQKIATRVFVAASVCFGIIGIVFAITIPGEADPVSDLNHTLFVLLAVTGFIVLSSFALSVAGKYLDSGRK
jgi:predicted membrane channel-forming protein YqfA (hemolysin III family)